MLGQAANEARIGFVGQLVIARAGDIAGIEVAVRKIRIARGGLVHHAAVVVDDVVHATEVEIFSLRSGIAIGEGFERAEARDDPQKEGKDSREDTRAVVFGSEFFFVIGARKMVKEFSTRLIVEFRHFFVLACGQRDLRHLGNDAADAEAEASDSQVFCFEQIICADTVSVAKGAVQQVLGNFEANEVVILFGNVPAFRDLQHVEAEFGFQVSRRVFLERDQLAKFGAQLGILDGDSRVHRGMPPNISNVVGERAKGEGVLVHVPCFA